MPKPQTTWTTEEDKAANFNSNAPNSIFNNVEIRRISKCTTARKAWIIFDIAYERISRVKQFKLQMLTSMFENLRMVEAKYLSNFYAM